MPFGNRHTDIINIIRDNLERTGRRIRDEGGKLTPYHIMEGLKEDIGDKEGFTCVGRLIKDSLGDRKMIENISWIAFHFDFPGREFSYSERDMRNWVALKRGDQELVNAIHKVTREFKDIQDCYAPSILFAQMSRKSKNAELVRIFRERWWLYKLTGGGGEFCPCPDGGACRSEEFQDIGIISFRESPDGKGVRLVFCPPVFGERKQRGLGSLINEAEKDSLQKFRNFKEIVHRTSDGKTALRCDFYVRVPLFFYGAEQDYVTDIFVALSAGKENNGAAVLEAGDIARILNDILPSIKSCVSMINSQVAYSLGEVTRRDKMAGLLHAVIRHDLNNLAAAADGSIGQLLEYDDILEKEEKREILQEIQANIALSTMCVELDFLWTRDVKEDLDDFVTIRKIKEALDSSWQFTSVLSCEFSGDWDSDVLVPKVCRIVLSNLLRNAINSNNPAEIRLHCRLEVERVDFGCLSEKKFSEFWKRRTFDEPLPLKIPKNNRGLWICRYVAESLGGEFYLAPEQGRYKTNIRFSVPVS